MEEQIYGFTGAIIELFLFFVTAMWIYCKSKFDYNQVSYYWLAFTVLTGLWEVAYVVFHENTVEMAEGLVKDNSHVWFQTFDWSMILPWNLSVVFYSEYAAWADREYMTDIDFWSRIIESTHALLCGFFSALAIFFKLLCNTRNFQICLAVAMGTQLMNSILYMGEYNIQTHDSDSLNYDTEDFPCGHFYSKRPFMWINVFWTIMPMYLIGYELTHPKMSNSGDSYNYHCICWIRTKTSY